VKVTIDRGRSRLQRGDFLFYDNGRANIFRRVFWRRYIGIRREHLYARRYIVHKFLSRAVLAEKSNRATRPLEISFTLIQQYNPIISDFRNHIIRRYSAYIEFFYSLCSRFFIFVHHFAQLCMKINVRSSNNFIFYKRYRQLLHRKNLKI